MLEDQDLQKIGQLIEKSEKRLTETLSTNIIKEVVDSVSDMFDNLEKSLTSTLADKESVNRMMDQSITRDEQLNKKINTMGDFLGKRQTLTAGEIAQLQSIQVFNQAKQ